MTLLDYSPRSVADVPCADLPSTLAALADQVATVKAGLTDAAGRVAWNGGAADAFHEHASMRYDALTSLIRDLSDSVTAVKGLHCVLSEITV